MFWRLVALLNSPTTAVGECTSAALVGLWFLCIGRGQTVECCGCWRSRGGGAWVQLTAGFAANATLATRTSLSRLGAEGMAGRMAVLEREGLLK